MDLVIARNVLDAEESLAVGAGLALLGSATAGRRRLEALSSDWVRGDHHAVAVLGYDDDGGSSIAQDSCGQGFGRSGQGFLEYKRMRINRIRVAYVIRALQFGGSY